MSNAEGGEITLMRAGEYQPAILLAQRSLDIRWTGKLCIGLGLRAISAAGKSRRGGLLESERRMRRRRAGKHLPLVVVWRRCAAIDDDPMLAGTHLEGKAAGMRLGAQDSGRRGRDVGNDKCRPALHTHIPRIGCSS